MGGKRLADIVAERTLQQQQQQQHRSTKKRKTTVTVVADNHHSDDDEHESVLSSSNSNNTGLKPPTTARKSAAGASKDDATNGGGGTALAAYAYRDFSHIAPSSEDAAPARRGGSCSPPCSASNCSPGLNNNNGGASPTPSTSIITTHRQQQHRQTSIRRQRFPAKLYDMLLRSSSPSQTQTGGGGGGGNGEFAGIITWMPHGRSWRIDKPHEFEAYVMPHYFEHCNYHSFNRLVNAWSFRRITRGPDKGSYYHEMFLRGKSHLHNHMRRLSRTEKKRPMMPAAASHQSSGGCSSSSASATSEPDFYAIAAVHPLPDDADAGEGEGHSMAPLSSVMSLSMPPMPMSQRGWLLQQQQIQAQTQQQQQQLMSPQQQQQQVDFATASPQPLMPSPNMAGGGAGGSFPAMSLDNVEMTMSPTEALSPGGVLLAAGGMSPGVLAAGMSGGQSPSSPVTSQQQLQQYQYQYQLQLQAQQAAGRPMPPPPPLHQSQTLQNQGHQLMMHNQGRQATQQTASANTNANIAPPQSPSQSDTANLFSRALAIQHQQLHLAQVALQTQQAQLRALQEQARMAANNMVVQSQHQQQPPQEQEQNQAPGSSSPAAGPVHVGAASPVSVSSPANAVANTTTAGEAAASAMAVMPPNKKLPNGALLMTQPQYAAAVHRDLNNSNNPAQGANGDPMSLLQYQTQLQSVLDRYRAQRAPAVPSIADAATYFQAPDAAKGSKSSSGGAPPQPSPSWSLAA